MPLTQTIDMRSAIRRPAAATLAGTVVAGGYCVGCGACTVVAGSPMRLGWTALGRLEAFEGPESSPGSTIAAEPAGLQAVCPFGAAAPDEDALAADLFPAAAPHPEIGRHLAAWAGHVAEGGWRQSGSSGGMGSWIAAELLRSGRVDAVLHVHPREPTEGDERLFAYGLSTTPEQVADGAKSRYYPVELGGVMATLRERPGRYAVIGVPCFVKAVRLLARQDPVVAERVAACVALVCGHLKSARFAESLAWQMGVPPAALQAVDFRHKLAGRPANEYGFALRSRGAAPGAAPLVRPMKELAGHDWGMGFFKLKACDYCDDVLGELADIVVGDAWLPDFLADSAGTNIVVVRRPDLAGMVEAAIAAGRLALRPIGADAVAASQRAGLRHRRDGLAYRLWLQDRAGRWRPPKRVLPRADHLGWRQRRVFRDRIALQELSHAAYDRARREGRLDLFLDAMRQPMRSYYATLKMPLWKLLLLPVRNWIRTFARGTLGPGGAQRRREAAR
ncbi:MAG: Coenzyme F420 hydrogenase/dehydrogenase, beta subunit C-terminal domain [Dongiaceae bacterium]